jgi:hypothetical protein
VSARHAGFASVITIDGGLVNQMLSAAATIFPAPSFSLPDLVTVGTNIIGIAGSVSFLTPTLSFAANPENLIGVAAGAVGLLQLTVNGADAIEVQLTLKFSMNVGLFINVSPSALALGPDFSDASVTSISIEVDFGPPLAPVFKDAITSGSVLNAITTALRAIPQKSVTFTVPGATGTISESLYGVNLTLPLTHVVAVPMNPNALTVAADVSGYTSGNQAKLVNLITTPSMGPTTAVTDPYTGTQTFNFGVVETHTGGGTNLAATVNGDFLSAVVNGPISSQIGGTSVSGLTLNTVSLAVNTVESDLSSGLPTTWYGCVSVSGTGDYGSFGFDFSGSVTPLLIENTSIFWDFSLASYSFGSPALDVIEFISAGLIIFGPVLINSIVGSIVANALTQLPSLGFGYSQSEPVPGLSGVSVNFTVNGIVAGWDPEIDTFITASVTAPPSSTAPSPPTFTLSAPSPAFTDPAPIPVTLAISDSALLTPILGLHISWLVVRNDTGATVLSQDTLLTSSALAISIDRWTGDLKYNLSWTVTCEVYHPADPITPKYTYFNQKLKVAIDLPVFALSSPPHNLKDSAPIPVTLSISDLAELLDPLLGLAAGLTIAWTAVRQDTGETVLNQATPLSSSALTVEIDRWSGTLIYNNTWLVTCKLYHAADSEVPQTTYFNQSLSVGVTDVVDRHHPYVHWQHTAFFHDPVSTPIPGLPLREHRLWHRSRHSRIHRTDILVRCEVLDFAVSKLLAEQGGVQPPPTPPSLSYVDTLATFGTFADVADWRHGVLCDYCFFGGPTKTTWKTPTAPTPPWE